MAPAASASEEVINYNGDIGDFPGREEISQDGENQTANRLTGSSGWVV